GYIVSFAETFERLCHADRKAEPLPRAVIHSLPAPRSILWQFEFGKRAFELTPPITEMCLEQLTLQPLCLPRREIRVLNRERRQGGWCTNRKGLVERHHLADENTH